MRARYIKDDIASSHKHIPNYYKNNCVQVRD
ncbi:hypothetical protein MS_004 [Vibrio phage VPMS1]|nr:hypothetical protein MS_004 [Vibrio phage VPMS1]AFV51083.1 hypothetical protein MS_004 [Vibrio phage VPMS1]